MMTANQLREEIRQGNTDILYGAMLGTNGGSDQIQDQHVIEDLALDILNEEYALDSWTPNELSDEDWATYCGWAGIKPWEASTLYIVLDNTVVRDVIVLADDCGVELTDHEAEEWLERLYEEDEDMAIEFFNSLSEEQRKNLRVYYVTFEKTDGSSWVGVPFEDRDYETAVELTRDYEEYLYLMKNGGGMASVDTKYNQSGECLYSIDIPDPHDVWDIRDLATIMNEDMFMKDEYVGLVIENREWTDLRSGLPGLDEEIATDGTYIVHLNDEGEYTWDYYCEEEEADEEEDDNEEE